MSKQIIDGVDIDQAALSGLRERHGKLYRGEIRVPAADGGDDEMVVFLFRRPVHRDSEALISRARQSPAIANRNLLAGLIVHPAPASVVDRLRDAPIALASFIESEILPFLGSAAEVASSEI